MPVPSLEGVRITQIACGGYHSLALTGKQSSANRTISLVGFLQAWLEICLV